MVTDNEQYLYDRKQFRNAAGATGAIVSLFILVPDLIVRLAVLIYNNTGFYFFSPILNIHPAMDMLLSSFLQIVGVLISVFCVTRFYQFSPLKLFSLYGLKSEENDELISETENNFEVNYNSSKWGKVIILAFPVIYFINVATSNITNMITNIVENNGIVVPEVDISFSSLDPATLIIYFLCLCVFAPLIEEFLMRGCMLKILRRYGNWFAIIVSSVMFGLLHNNIGQGVSAVVIGIAFGTIAVKCESIWPTIILHALNNFLYFIVGIFSNIDNEVLISLSSVVILLIALVGLIIFSVILKKYHIQDNNRSCLSRKECWGRYFTNILVLIYLAINLFNFIYPFYVENK